MEGWIEEKTEGLKCMDVCRDGWMEEFKCIGHKLQIFLLGLVVGFMRGLRRCMTELEGARE